MRRPCPLPVERHGRVVSCAPLLCLLAFRSCLLGRVKVFAGALVPYEASSRSNNDSTRCFQFIYSRIRSQQRYLAKMGLALRPPPGTAGAAWPAIVVGFFVAFGGVLFVSNA